MELNITPENQDTVAKQQSRKFEQFVTRRIEKLLVPSRDVILDATKIFELQLREAYESTINQNEEKINKLNKIIEENSKRLKDLQKIAEFWESFAPQELGLFLSLTDYLEKVVTFNTETVEQYKTDIDSINHTVSINKQNLESQTKNEIRAQKSLIDHEEKKYFDTYMKAKEYNYQLMSKDLQNAEENNNQNTKNKILTFISEKTDEDTKSQEKNYKNDAQDRQTIIWKMQNNQLFEKLLLEKEASTKIYEKTVEFYKNQQQIINDLQAALDNLFTDSETSGSSLDASRPTKQRHLEKPNVDTRISDKEALSTQINYLNDWISTQDTKFSKLERKFQTIIDHVQYLMKERTLTIKAEQGRAILAFEKCLQTYDNAAQICDWLESEKESKYITKKNKLQYMKKNDELNKAEEKYLGKIRDINLSYANKLSETLASLQDACNNLSSVFDVPQLEKDIHEKEVKVAIGNGCYDFQIAKDQFSNAMGEFTEIMAGFLMRNRIRSRNLKNDIKEVVEPVLTDLQSFWAQKDIPHEALKIVRPMAPTIVLIADRVANTIKEKSELQTEKSNLEEKKRNLVREKEALPKPLDDETISKLEGTEKIVAGKNEEKREKLTKSIEIISNRITAVDEMIPHKNQELREATKDLCKKLAENYQELKQFMESNSEGGRSDLDSDDDRYYSSEDNISDMDTDDDDEYDDDDDDENDDDNDDDDSMEL